jgi:SH3-like domain-containing protein
MSLVAGLLLTALVVQTVWIDAVPRAVVVTDRDEAKFAPQTTATAHFTLPEGVLVRVLGQEFGWAQIKRADGRTGWVPADSMKALSR